MKDIVEIANNSLYLRFDLSGNTKRISILPLDKQIIFFTVETSENNKNCTLYVESNGVESILETFVTPQLAFKAVERINRKIINLRVKNLISRLLKGIILWIYFPLVIFATLLVINYGITAYITLNSQQNAPINTLATEPVVSSQRQPKSAGATQNLDVLQQLPVTSNELAEALSNGVSSDKYSIHLSPKKEAINQKKPNIYVFSDPLCPHCRKIEPKLKKLVDNYDVYIFPVSIIGKAKSAELIVSTLCSDYKERQHIWSDVIDGLLIKEKNCKAGLLALEANNEMFRAMKFLGTPTIISEKGNILPLSVPFTEEEISNWVNKH